MRGMNTGGHGQAPVPSAVSETVETAAERPEGLRETRLDNGVIVRSEHMPGVRSAAAGVWIRQGSAHETPETTGVSHLLEHMVFKGTERRTARAIAESLESLGGSLDAYTSREHTSYQARVLDEDLPVALDVLSDLVLAPKLEADDLALEREVILEEIAQVEDTPDDLVFELHGERLWAGHPYGMSILGTKASVSAMRAETLRALHAERYVGANMLVAAAGNVDHESFVTEVEGRFGRVSTGRASEPVAPPRRTATGLEVVDRDTAQTHIVFGAEAPAHADPDRFAVVLLTAALGGGMSSRLFQRVREELGLCYAVFTYQSFYGAAGLVGVYVGTRPGSAEAASDAVRVELERVAREGLAPEELDRVRQQVKGQVMLSLESTGSRLHRLASSALHDEPFLSLDELVRRIDAVTTDDVTRLAERHFHPDRQLELRLGPTS